MTVPLGALEIIRGEDNLTLYTWGTHTAQHWFCKTCGTYTHHRRRSNPNEYGVNVGAQSYFDALATMLDGARGSAAGRTSTWRFFVV